MPELSTKPTPSLRFRKAQISDRFMDGKFYKVNALFEGAKPENNYTPEEPTARAR